MKHHLACVILWLLAILALAVAISEDTASGSEPIAFWAAILAVALGAAPIPIAAWYRKC